MHVVKYLQLHYPWLQTGMKELWLLQTAVFSLQRCIQRFWKPYLYLLCDTGSGIFGIILAMIFAVVKKINHFRILYLFRLFCELPPWDTPLVQLVTATYFGFAPAEKPSIKSMGRLLISMLIPASVFAIIAFAFNEAAYASETIRQPFARWIRVRSKQLAVWGMTNRQSICGSNHFQMQQVGQHQALIKLLIRRQREHLWRWWGVWSLYELHELSGGSDYHYLSAYFRFHYLLVVSIID